MVSYYVDLALVYNFTVGKVVQGFHLVREVRESQGSRKFREIREKSGKKIFIHVLINVTKKSFARRNVCSMENQGSLFT